MKQESNYSGSSGEVFLEDLRVGSVGEWSIKDEGNTLHFIAKQYFLNKFWMSGMDLSKTFTLRLKITGKLGITFQGKFVSRSFELGRYVKDRLYLRSFEKLKIE